MALGLFLVRFSCLAPFFDHGRQCEKIGQKDSRKFGGFLVSLKCRWFVLMDAIIPINFNFSCPIFHGGRQASVRSEKDNLFSQLLFLELGSIGFQRNFERFPEGHGCRVFLFLIQESQRFPKKVFNRLGKVLRNIFYGSRIKIENVIPIQNRIYNAFHGIDWLLVESHEAVSRSSFGVLNINESHGFAAMVAGIKNLPRKITYAWVGINGREAPSLDTAMRAGV